MAQFPFLMAGATSVINHLDLSLQWSGSLGFCLSFTGYHPDNYADNKKVTDLKNRILCVLDVHDRHTNKNIGLPPSQIFQSQCPQHATVYSKEQLLLLTLCPQPLPTWRRRSDACWAITDFGDNTYLMLVSCSDSFVEWSEREGSLADRGQRNEFWECLGAPINFD